MALSFVKMFNPKLVGNSAPDTLFSVPAIPDNTIIRNGRVRFSNSTSAFATVKGWIITSGGAAGAENVFLPMTSIAANSYLDIDIPVMAAGDSLQAQAGTANAVTALFIDGFMQS